MFMNKIVFNNMPYNSSKLNFALRYLLNNVRTWFYFHVRWPWVKYKGFVRVMKGTSFAHFPIRLGHNVQFGDYCNVSTPLTVGNNVLFAGRVCFVGKNDHTFDVPGQLIWQGERGDNGMTVVEDDVWVGANSVILPGIIVHRGAVIAAGSIVTKDVPEYASVAGNPAKVIKYRE